MTHIDEILTLANKFANEGKKPTVALIKAKLSIKLPLMLIINTLKTWEHDPNFIACINSENKVKHSELITKDNNQLSKLIEKIVAKELSQVKKELEELKGQVAQLSKK